MTATLSGPERMLQMAMKAMGINPQDLIEKFKEPIEQGLSGIKDVDNRLKNLEDKVEQILSILTKGAENDRSNQCEFLVIDNRTSSDDSPEYSARIAS